jgi:hypothetical protein
MTLSKTTLSITTLSKMTLSIAILSKTTLTINCLYVPLTLTIIGTKHMLLICVSDTQHKRHPALQCCHYAVSHFIYYYAECHNAECRYTERHYC